MENSGRGAAWLARLLGVQEVPSSNLGGPTINPLYCNTDLPPRTGLYANNGGRPRSQTDQPHNTLTRKR
jgi:hypothetical protein